MERVRGADRAIQAHTRQVGGREGSEVVLIRLDGGGHTWPGGGQYLPEGLIGRVCHDLSAATVIWEFFRAHPKP